eukprot:SAG22_NODE_1747_length_3665_cov_2.556085_3_plen_112_part_00
MICNDGMTIIVLGWAMQIDPTRRFGCLKAGADDVKQHYYFAEVDWASAAAGGLTPPWRPADDDRTPLDPADDPWGVAWYRQDEEKDQFAPFDPAGGEELTMLTHQALFKDF